MSFRAESAGYQLGGAVVEMVNLMYQNSTAAKFYSGLVPVLNLEIERRSLNNKVVKITSTNIDYTAALEAEMRRNCSKDDADYMNNIYIPEMAERLNSVVKAQQNCT